MGFQGIILDVDGTLVLSNDAHAQAWVEAFAASGYNVAFEQVRPLIGMGGDQIIPMLTPGLNDQEGVGKAISDRRKALILEKFGPDLEAAPGSQSLVQRMQAEGLKTVIASSATKEELSLLLQIAHLEDLVADATSSKDTEASKPAPDVVEVALQKLSLPVEQVVMLGDTPYDVEAAAQAGVAVIAVRCGGFSDQQLSGAIAIYDHPGDLLAQYNQSPLGH
jgi:beta-phosphoglucomutase-like phosphatase (HAD superfamily)